MNDWETAIEELRRKGWNVRWFSYVSRTGHGVWRVSASKPGQPAMTIEADFLREAILGVAKACEARTEVSKAQ